MQNTIPRFFKFTPAGKNLHKVELTYVGELLYMRQ